MKGADRKAAVAAYKEQKVAAGVYVVRCAPTGQAWVGSAPNVATVWSRLSFTLRQNGHKGRSLQDAWTAHQPEDFSFEAVETLEDEADAYVQGSLLRERVAHWKAELEAEAVV